MRFSTILQKFYCIVILVITTGCCSKNVWVVDTNNNPVQGAMIAAYQQNVLGPNKKELYKTDSNGLVSVSFSGLVSLYIGKEGYEINNAIISETDYKVVLMKYGDEPPSVKHISHLLSDHYVIPANNLWNEWVVYINWLKAQRQPNAKSKLRVDNCDF